MKKIFIPLIAFASIFSCSGRSGGNDAPDKGSPQAKVSVFIEKLPSVLSESSGLLVFHDLFWSFNDSGGKSMLYGVNRAGEIVKSVEIVHAGNDDWEDIAQDEDYIYIGDFGNNNGSRKNLAIYRVSKPDLQNNEQVEAEKISFVYLNQKNYNFRPLHHEFDCEALISFKNQLYLFSKDWVNEKTRTYTFKGDPAVYQVAPVDSFDVRALITGADLSPDGKTLALIGYHDFKPVLRLFSNFTSDNFFEGDVLFFNLDTIDGAQTEGVAFMGNDTLLISCESTMRYKQQVFYIDLKELNSDATHTGY